MKTSIATVCLAGTLEEKMQACARAGFDGIEIFEQDLVVSPSSPAEIKALAERLNLSLDLYQPFRDLEGVTEEVFQDNLRRLEATFQLMQQLGMDLILVPSNVATATVDDDAVVAEQLHRAAELAARYDMRIAYEALAWGTYVNTYWHSWELVQSANHPNLGVCLDSFHILSKNDDPSLIPEIPGEKIFFVQLADAPELGMDLLPWSRHHRVFPGEGSFAMFEFMAYLTQTGYQGPLSLEIFNDVFRETDPDITAVDGLRSLRWIQQGARGLLAKEHPFRQILTPMPKVDPIEVIDHIEISTDVPDRCGALLGSLGFTFVGQHRRKTAQLFVCGDVKVVLTPNRAEGTFITSVAVQVANSADALARAEALGATPVSRPVTADEARLKGVLVPAVCRCSSLTMPRPPGPKNSAMTPRTKTTPRVTCGWIISMCQRPATISGPRCCSPARYCAWSHCRAKMWLPRADSSTLKSSNPPTPGSGGCSTRSHRPTPTAPVNPYATPGTLPWPSRISKPGLKPRSTPAWSSCPSRAITMPTYTLGSALTTRLCSAGSP